VAPLLYLAAVLATAALSGGPVPHHMRVVAVDVSSGLIAVCGAVPQKAPRLAPIMPMSLTAFGRSETHPPGCGPLRPELRARPSADI
jgi:hypothetical protein